VAVFRQTELHISTGVACVGSVPRTTVALASLAVHEHPFSRGQIDNTKVRQVIKACDAMGTHLLTPIRHINSEIENESQVGLHRTTDEVTVTGYSDVQDFNLRTKTHENF
jgi:hypothetical protein